MMQRGYFKNKCPRIKILIEGPTASEEVEALVDTGFSDYLTIPTEVADRVGLTEIVAVGFSVLADGSSSPSVSYLGRAIFNNTRVVTAIEVQPHCKVLLGMSLLDAFGLNLFVDLKADRVELNQSETRHHDLH
jgi:clan AA aspartic protease